MMIFNIFILLLAAAAQGNGFTLKCYELYFKAVLEKGDYTADNITLEVPGCQSRESQDNTTHIWMTVEFIDCVEHHKESGDVITQEVTIFLKRYNNYKDIIQRNVIQQYRLQCHFNRRLNVVTGDYFNTTGGAKKFNASGESNFNADINFYTTISFLEVAELPHTATSYQPIFVGITEKNDNSKYTFVVHQCLATSTSAGSGLQYIFFDRKCAIDSSFEIVTMNRNNFYFKFLAFDFMKLYQSIRIHCKLLICAEGAKSSDCSQVCTGLISRRSVPESLPVDEITVISPEISFKKVSTCAEIVCPPNSRCVELYPADCICNDGFVLNFKEMACSNINPVQVSGMHIDRTFLPTYSDPSSPDFLMLEKLAKEALIPLFKENDDIVGVRILAIRPGSIVLDLMLLYAKNVSVEKAKEIFISTVFVEDIRKQNSTLLRKIKMDIIPQVVLLEPTQAPMIEDSNAVIIAAVSGVIVIIMMAFLICTLHRFIRNRRRGNGVINYEATTARKF